MFYIRTADRLTRTSVWLDKMEGGIEHLRDVVVDDSLGIAADLERDMQQLVDTYECEWADVVRDPEKRAHVPALRERSRAGTTRVRFVPERGQPKPDDPHASDPLAGRAPPAAPAAAVGPGRVGPRRARRRRHRSPLRARAARACSTSTARGEWYATQNLCPHKQEMVLARGIVGDQAGAPKVACPLHKKTFDLRTGACLSGDPLEIATFPVRVEGDDVLVELPPVDELEAPSRAHDCAPCAAEAHGELEASDDRTHCPYCAFQCGMTVTSVEPGAERLQVVGRPRLPGQPRADVHQGVHLRGAPRSPRAAPNARCSARRDGRLAAASLGRRRSTSSPSASLASATRTARAALAAFGSGALTNEKAYLLGKFARVALAVAEHRLQRPLLHGLGRGRAEPRVRDRPRAAVPGLGHRRDEDPHALGLELRRDDAAHHAVDLRAARPRRDASSSSTRAAPTRRAPATLHLQLTPGTDLALANGLLHLAIEEKLVDEAYVARADRGLRRGPAERPHERPGARRAADRASPIERAAPRRPPARGVGVEHGPLGPRPRAAVEGDATRSSRSST